MQIHTRFLPLALILAACAPAYALTTPSDTSAVPSELPVYEIYNDLYGTSFTTNADLDALQVDMETFSVALGGAASVEAVARYAGSTQIFGWYESDGGGGLAEHFLFHVTDYGDVQAGGYDATFSPAGEFGFFLDPVGQRADPFKWYSQDALNGGQEHMLVYATPTAGVYFLAWEDLNLNRSDLDYNDLALELILEGPVVPEPSSMVLLGAGLAAMTVFRLRLYSKA